MYQHTMVWSCPRSFHLHHPDPTHHSDMITKGVQKHRIYHLLEAGAAVEGAKKYLSLPEKLFPLSAGSSECFLARSMFSSVGERICGNASACDHEEQGSREAIPCLCCLLSGLDWGCCCGRSPCRRACGPRCSSDSTGECMRSEVKVGRRGVYH